jgi:hypothetical protein
MMSTRVGLALGITLTVAVAVWWLGASRVALQSGGDAALMATQALFVFGLLRAMLIAVSAPRIAASDGYRAGVHHAIPIVTAAWPAVVLAWSASATSVPQVLLVECALLCGALVAPLPGRMLARWRLAPASLLTLASLAGITLACGVWLVAIHWRQLAGWAHA